MKKIMFVTIILLMLSLVPVLAQNQDEGTFLRVDELLGYPIADEEGIPIGFLQDLVIHRDGSIPFLVAQFQMTGYTLSYDRYLIPMERVDIERDENAIVVTGMDLTALQDLPGLEDNTRYEDLNEGYWGPYYGWWGMNPGPGVDNTEAARELGFREIRDPEKVQGILASELEGYEFVNPEGEEVGDVEGIMVNVDQQQVAYIGLSFGGFLGIDDKNVAIPLNRVSLDTEDEALYVDVTEEELEAAEGFDDDEWPSRPEAALFDQGS